MKLYKNPEWIQKNNKKMIPGLITVVKKTLLFPILICLCMLMDNGVALPFFFITKQFSVYLAFFNSIVFTGMFGTYISTAIISYMCYSVTIGSDHRILIDLNRTMHKRQYYLCVFLGGFTVLIAYTLFILVLSIFVPFVNELDIQSGLTYYPYVQASLSGNVIIHIAAILFYGFLTGCIISSISLLSIAFTNNQNIIILSPFFSKFCFVQFCRILNIPIEWRIDYWLYMRATFVNELCTLSLSLLSTVSIIFFISIIINKKRGTN